MQEETLEALKGSIKKWTAIAAGTEEDRGEENCPLCQRFIGTGKCCAYYKEFCPAAEAVGDTGCRGTPYMDWRRHMEVDHGHPDVWNVQCPTCKSLALKELGFLVYLLPKEGGA